MSIKKLLVAFAFSTVLLNSACATQGKDMASADMAIAAAEAANQAAAKAGYEWRDTAKMIEQAKGLAKEGKTADAINLAKKAEEQGKDAVAQYNSESKRFAAMK